MNKPLLQVGALRDWFPISSTSFILAARKSRPAPQAGWVAQGRLKNHLRKIRRAYADRIASMSQAILAHFPEDTRVTEPGGGFVLWVQLLGKLDSVKLYQEALKAFIAIAPGYLFSPAHKFDDFIRLNASCWSERSEQDLMRLGMVAKRLLSGRH